MSNLNFNNLFGNSPVDITCPKCSTEFPITLNQIGTSVICTGCNSSINLQADDSFNAGKRGVDKASNDLSKTLNSFGK